MGAIVSTDISLKLQDRKRCEVFVTLSHEEDADILIRSEDRSDGEMVYADLTNAQARILAHYLLQLVDDGEER